MMFDRVWSLIMVFKCSCHMSFKKLVIFKGYLKAIQCEVLGKVGMSFLTCFECQMEVV